MAQVNLGRVSLFANVENLLNVRQTKYDPLVLPRRAPSGTWTVDGWAPTDGIVFNAGVKFKFGGDRD
jgi:iron complex outermembrane receptor protein